MTFVVFCPFKFNSRFQHFSVVIYVNQFFSDISLTVYYYICYFSSWFTRSGIIYLFSLLLFYQLFVSNFPCCQIFYFPFVLLFFVYFLSLVLLTHTQSLKRGKIWMLKNSSLSDPYILNVNVISICRFIEMRLRSTELLLTATLMRSCYDFPFL